MKVTHGLAITLLGLACLPLQAQTLDPPPPPSSTTVTAEGNMDDMIQALELNVRRHRGPVTVAKKVVELAIDFENNSAKLPHTAHGMLNLLTQAMNSPKLTSLRFVIQGGYVPVQDRQNITQLRALSVYSYLIDKGISRERLSYDEKGQEATPNTKGVRVIVTQ